MSGSDRKVFLVVKRRDFGLLQKAVECYRNTLQSQSGIYHCERLIEGIVRNEKHTQFRKHVREPLYSSGPWPDKISNGISLEEKISE